MLIKDPKTSDIVSGICLFVVTWAIISTIILCG